MTFRGGGLAAAAWTACRSKKRVAACHVAGQGRRRVWRGLWPVGLAGLVALIALALPLAGDAMAQTTSLRDLLPPGDGTATGRMIQLVALITVLSVAPGLLIMVTCFTRFVIAFSFLRAGLGLQTTPPNLVLISLAMFMTFYVMAPAFDRAWTEGIKPLVENQIKEEDAYYRITAPFRDFMKQHVREKDLRLFEELAAVKPPAGAEQPANGKEPQVELRVLIPAFMISELRRGFEIGFLITLPFLVIDMIVATLIMSMGMMMLPPSLISLPFKVLFFVLIDGWNLLVGGLIRSFL
jgi:flagellar biosynthetic protein FliP